MRQLDDLPPQNLKYRPYIGEPSRALTSEERSALDEIMRETTGKGRVGLSTGAESSVFVTIGLIALALIAIKGIYSGFDYVSSTIIFDPKSFTSRTIVGIIVLIVGAIAFSVRHYYRDFYAVAEISSAFGLAFEAWGRLQGNQDALPSALIATAYIAVRGLDNLQTARKQQAERRKKVLSMVGAGAA